MDDKHKERLERIATAILAAINARVEIGRLDYDPYVDAVYQADTLIAELDKDPTHG